MKIISIKEQRAIQLQLLQQISTFCQENDIMNFLAYGTLLGAIIHKGFMPWDDDIDIAMPRSDYEWFVRLFNNAFKFSKAVVMNNNEKYGFPFAKVHNIRTIVNEIRYHQDCFGLYIDIFPIDGIKDETQIYKSLQFKILFHTKNTNFAKRKLLLIIIHFFGEIILFPFSLHNLTKIADKNAKQYAVEKRVTHHAFKAYWIFN